MDDFTRRLAAIATLEIPSPDQILGDTAFAIQPAKPSSDNKYDITYNEIYIKHVNKKPLSLREQAILRGIIETDKKKKALLTIALERFEKDAYADANEKAFVLRLLQFYKERGFLTKKQYDALKVVIYKE